jgi:hypothetical protein
MSSETLERPATLTSPEDVAKAAATMVPLLFGKHITYSLSAVARLGVADHMLEGPADAETLARLVGAHPDALRRVMRALAAVGVFNQQEDGSFSLTPAGQLLCTNAPGSVRHFAIQIGDRWATRAFEHFQATVCTGKDAISQAFGKNIFDYFADEPEESANFNRSMTAFSAAVAQAVVNAYDFTSVGKLADVGGGHGFLLASVLDANPHLSGVVFDLPEVAAGALDQPHFANCSSRVQIEAGSFFERVPERCDAYMMKSIIHDWSDDHCVTILNLIRQQLPPNGRLLVIEQVLGDRPDLSLSTFLDLEMLTMTVGGRERTGAQFRHLFSRAGLELTRIIPTRSFMSIIEARLA